jgi:hypothetical protein
MKTMQSLSFQIQMEKKEKPCMVAMAQMMAQTPLQMVDPSTTKTNRMALLGKGESRGLYRIPPALLSTPAVTGQQHPLSKTFI